MFEYFSKIFRENLNFIKSDKNNGYFTWRPSTFLIISRSVLHRTRNVADKSCRENNTFFFQHLPPPENLAVYEIMFKNILQPDRPQMKIWRMRFTFWIPKAKYTLSVYVIINTFPVQLHCYAIHTKPLLLVCIAVENQFSYEISQAYIYVGILGDAIRT